MDGEPKHSREPLDHAPCRSCPWRKDSDPTGKDIPGYNIERLRGLCESMGDGPRPIMGCHYMQDEIGFACVGYLYRDGYQNLNVRLYLRKHGLSIADIDAACEQIDIWENYEAMLAAFEEAHQSKI